MPLAFNRTIESPGVEIRELDYTLNVGLPVGTNIMALGFAPQGPTFELLNVTSITEFELIYGTPTNAAERYFYHTCKQILAKNGNLIATRLPYGSGDGEGFGSNYSALVYPIVATSGLSSVNDFPSASGFYILAPQQITLTEDQYKNIDAGVVSWADTVSSMPTTGWSYSNIGQAGLIVLNKSKRSTNELFEGQYIILADNTKLGFGTDFDCVRGFNTVTQYRPNADYAISTSLLNFSLTGSYNDSNGTTSEIIEGIPTFQFGDVSYSDSLVLGVVKLRTSLFASDARTISLDQVLSEAYIGSLDFNRKIQRRQGGQPETFFIENVVNEASDNIKVLVNPNISQYNTTQWTDVSGNLQKKVRLYSPLRSTDVPAVPEVTTTDYVAITGFVATGSSYTGYADFGFALGPFVPRTFGEVKAIGALPSKIDRALRLAENVDEVPVDVIVEGGLGTIHTFNEMASGIALAPWCSGSAYRSLYAAAYDGSYRDDLYLPTIQVADTDINRSNGVTAGLLIDQEYSSETMGSDAQNTGRNSWAANLYQAVYNQFNTFVEFTRRPGSVFIADPLRQTLVQGELPVIDCMVSGVRYNFPQHVYWGLRNLYAESNSSYSVTYANWVQSYDTNSDRFAWLPFSGYAAGIYANVDRNTFPWFAPAGLNRGIISDVVQLAINPTQKQRDLLYRHGINPICFFPQDGYVVWGQKTLFKKPSAFDRINVRRLFLVLEKATVAAARYFVFEPNTIFTRARMVDKLRPIFERAKNNEGVYDYLIICDERNNPPDVIDRNELVVDIYLKPVRAAEYILISFIATRTGQDFSELI